MTSVPLRSLAVLAGFGLALCGLQAQVTPATPAPAPAAASSSAPAEEESAYIRLVEDGPVARLETAIARLRNADGVEVDLYGAVHIADRSYYDALDEFFTSYEAVLFELVVDGDSDLAPQLGTLSSGERAESAFDGPERLGLNLLGIGQQMIGKLLHLTFQGEEIDYRAQNFVHADMTMQQFQAAQAEAQESLFSSVAEMERADSGLSPEEKKLQNQHLLSATLQMFMGNPQPVKRFLAAEMTREFSAASGEGSETVLVEGRNRVALEVLDRQLEEGRRHLAIFYGAAHLEDMVDQLKQRGFEVESLDWLPAWTLDSSAAPAPSDPSAPAAKPSAEIPRPTLV